MDLDTFPGEATFREVILADLKRGRPGWDVPHTEAVVYWVKELLLGLGLNAKVLVAAAYAHDWGYIDLFPEGATYDKIQEMKPKHMQVGAERIGRLLVERLADEFSQLEIDRVRHLVAVHDKLDQVSEEDELLLVEADTLGALDVDRVTPTYSSEDNQKYLQEVLDKRRPLFVHERAIEAFEELMAKRRHFYEAL